MQIFYSKFTFSKNHFRITISVSNNFDSYQVPTFCKAWSRSKVFAKVIGRAAAKDLGDSIVLLGQKSRRQVFSHTFQLLKLILAIFVDGHALNDHFYQISF